MTVVMVASTGGHLHQLHMLADRLAPDSKRCWVTFDGPQARSLLAGEVVEYVPYVAPRGYRGLLSCLRLAPRILHRHEAQAVVSTGSGVALAFLPVAALKGIPAVYIESATRVDGPSFTGRWLARMPRVQVFTQWPAWADDRWQYAGSVFDGFTAETRRLHDRPIGRVVVSCGTIRPYGFRRLIERLVGMLPSDAEVLWQTGATDVRGLGIDARPEIEADALRRAIRDADLVVAHAGTGIALTALEEGKCPVLVPREAGHDEHVDDHQFQTATALAERGLAISARVHELTESHLIRAVERQILRTGVPPFELGVLGDLGSR